MPTPASRATDSSVTCGPSRETPVAGRRAPADADKEDCQEARPNQPGTRTGYAAYAMDPEAAERLWRVSEDMLRS